MHLKDIYPKELVEAYFNRDSVVNLGTGVNNFLKIVLAAIALGLTLYAVAAQNPWLLVFGAISLFSYYSYATRDMNATQKGIEINDKELKLLLFFPDIWYKRPLTAIRRVKFNPETKASKSVLAKYGLTPVTVYFWVYGGMHIIDNKLLAPVTVFLPNASVGEVKALFAKLPEPEKELKEITG